MASAGLSKKAMDSRKLIKKVEVRRAVSPGFPVAPQVVEVTSEPSEAEVPQVAPTIEPTEVKLEAEPVIPTSEPSMVQTLAEPRVQAPKASKVKPKKKTANHVLPRIEGRLSGDHQKILGAVYDKAIRECLRENKGLNNSELIGGFIEFMRPFYKKLTFSNINFKRGKLYGDGTEQIKVGVGESIKRAAFESLVSEVVGGNRELVSSIPRELREQLIAALGESEGSVVLEEESLVANG